MKFETILDALVKSAEYMCADPYRFADRLRQVGKFRARLVKMYEEAYYHGVNVGLEVADPELYGEDHAV